jgi:FecR-like protein
LPQVMQKLSAYYNIKIQYDSTLIDTMNFTGTVTKKDSLPVILKAITQMNNLNVTQEDGKFTISKLQQQ